MKSFKNAGGMSLVKFHLKTKGFSREVPQKVEKTSRESVGREREHCKLQLILKKMELMNGLKDLPDVGHGLQFGTPLPQAPGVRMT